MKRKFSEIKEIEIKTGTKEWLDCKAKYFGGSDCACLVHEGFNTREEIINDKISEKRNNNISNAMLKGLKYEPYVKKEFEKRNNCILEDKNLRFHKDISFLTATPDSIITNINLSNTDMSNNNISKFLKISTLVEFKVRKELDRKIPYKYFIQCQIQMEVFNIENCIYCENVISDSTGLLVDFYECNITRDSNWFNKFKPILFTAWEEIQYRKTTEKPLKDFNANNTNNNSKIIINTIEQIINNNNTPIIMTSHFLWNSIHKEPLGDWLMLTSPPIEIQTDNFPKIIHSYKLQMKYKVKEFLSLSIKSNPSIIKDVDTELSIFPEYCKNIKPIDICKYNKSAIELTQKFIKNNEKIIFNSHHSVNDKNFLIYVKCDILIRKDMLNLFNIKLDDDFEDSDGLYYPILIEYSTLNLKVDQVHMINNEKQNMYKSKLVLANIVDKNLKKTGFVIGRKSEYTLKGIKHINTSAFSKIARVDFFEGGIDEESVNDVSKCIDWFKFLHSDEFNHYRNIPVTKLLKDPLYDSFRYKEYLKPNCKNHNDQGYSHYKKLIVEETGELTQLYKFGVKFRNYANENGINNIEDLRKNPEFGIKNRGITYDYITAFLDSINNSKEVYKIKLEPHRSPIECFIDFEFTNNIVDDFKSFPECSKTSIVYMLGCTTVNKINKTIIHRSYLTDRLSTECENDLIKNFINDLTNLIQTFKLKCLPLYHWSSAEKNILYNLLKEKNIDDLNIKLIDVLQFIRDEKLILPNTNGFGLKEIGKKLYEYGLIETTWKDELHGLSAMANIFEAEAYCVLNKGKKLLDFHKTKNVIEYNYIDCIVVKEILSLLRGEPKIIK